MAATGYDNILILGSDPACDIQIDHPVVSGQHLRVEIHDEAFFIRDLNSTNGTFVNGRKITQPTPVNTSDSIQLGSYAINLAQLVATGRGPVATMQPPPRASTQPSLQATAAGASVPQVHQINQAIIVGRSTDCDIVVPEQKVSGMHARIFRNAGRVIIEDMGSGNGTWWSKDGSTQEMPISSKALGHMDIIRIGSRRFHFRRDPTLDAAREASANVVVKNLVVTVKDRDTGQPRNIVDDISFTALPGEVVGIMGASGSGKTTLLNVLAGFYPPSDGDVLVAGSSVFLGDEMRTEMATHIGHAPQHSQVHPELTVEEAVRYSAMLRGPREWTTMDVERRVDQAIRDVDLADKRDTMIGSAEDKVLSGGQIKRVNIAMELVNAPQVLLLDEPTSGLSSEDTKDVMEVIRRLADNGRTIILIIHQPSYSAFLHLDQLLLLKTGGLVAYFGHAAQDSFGFFNAPAREPERLLERLDNPPEPGADANYWVNKYRTQGQKQWADHREAALLNNPGASLPSRPPRSVPSHVLSLLARTGLMRLGWKGLKPRDKFFWLLSFVVPLAVSILFAWVLITEVTDHKDWVAKSKVEHGFLVVLTIMVCFFGALSSALEINRERVILRRERRGGLTLTAYLISKAISYAIPTFGFPAFALAGVRLVELGHDITILEGSYLLYWLVLGAAFFAASCAGLLISAIIRRAQTVILVAVFYAIVQVVFSAFVPLNVTYKEESAQTEKCDKEDKSCEKNREGRAKALAVFSAPITARWTLGGLVAVDDLCSGPDGEPNEDNDTSHETEPDPHNEDNPENADRTPPHPEDLKTEAIEKKKELEKQRAVLGFVAEACKPKFYRNHGVYPASKSNQRTDSKHVKTAILMNLLFALDRFRGLGFE